MNVEKLPEPNEQNKVFVMPLPGKVIEQFVQCSRPCCRCRKGRRHGPYYYRVWREKDKVNKVYVKATDVETVWAQCAEHRRLEQLLRDYRAKAKALQGHVEQRRKVLSRLKKTWSRTPLPETLHNKSAPEKAGCRATENGQ